MFDLLAEKPTAWKAFIVALIMLWMLGAWNVSNLYGDVEANKKSSASITAAVADLKKDVEATTKAVAELKDEAKERDKVAEARFRRLEDLMISIIQKR